MDEMPGQYGRPRQRQPQSGPSWQSRQQPYDQQGYDQQGYDQQPYGAYGSHYPERDTPFQSLDNTRMQRVLRWLRGPFAGASCLAICLAFCSIGSVGAIAVGVHASGNDAVYATVATYASPTSSDASTTSTSLTATHIPGQQQGGQQQQPAPSNTLTIAMTCSHAIDHSTGRFCVHTQPAATLHITVTYCSGTADSSPNLQGARTADGDGNYEWDWIPETPCKGQATADVSASWHGQSAEQSFTFTVEDWTATPTPTGTPVTPTPTGTSGTPTPTQTPPGGGKPPTPTPTPSPTPIVTVTVP